MQTTGVTGYKKQRYTVHKFLWDTSVHWNTLDVDRLLEIRTSVEHETCKFMYNVSICFTAVGRKLCGEGLHSLECKDNVTNHFHYKDLTEFLRSNSIEWQESDQWGHVFTFSFKSCKDAMKFTRYLLKTL